MVLLKLLKSIDAHRVGHAASVIVILVLVTYNHHLRVRKAEVEYVYGNPKIVEKIQIKRVEGPVRVITVIKEVPGGAKETTVVEDRGVVVEDSGLEETKEPVPVRVALGEGRQSRWLLGAGLLDVSQDRHPMLLGGVSIKNRVDLLYGANTEHGELQHSAFFVTRF